MAGGVTGLAASNPPGQDRQKSGMSGRTAPTVRDAAASERTPAFRTITAERPENGGTVAARLRALVDDAQPEHGAAARLGDGVSAKKRAPPVPTFDTVDRAITDRHTLIRGIAAYREALDLARAAPFTTTRGG